MATWQSEVKHDHTTLLIEAVALAVILGAVLIIIAVRWQTENRREDKAFFVLDVLNARCWWVRRLGGVSVTNEMSMWGLDKFELPNCNPENWANYGVFNFGTNEVIYIMTNAVKTETMNLADGASLSIPSKR